MVLGTPVFNSSYTKSKTIKDGEALLSIENLDEKIEAESFSFDYEDKKHGKLEGFIDESSGSFELFATKEGNKYSVSSISLEKFDEFARKTSSLEYSIEKTEKRLEDLRSGKFLVDDGEGGKRKATKEEIMIFESTLIDQKNQLSLLNEDFDSAIERTEDFMNRLRDEQLSGSELEKNIKLSLAELYKNRYTSFDRNVIPFYESEKLEYEKALQDYDKSLELYTELKNTAAKEDNPQLYADASLGLADLYVQQNNPEKAIAEYSQLISKSEDNPFIQSKAIEGRGIVNLKQGDVKEALQDFALSLEIDPENQKVAELQKEVFLGILKEVNSKLSNEQKGLYSSIMSKLGWTGVGRDVSLGASGKELVQLFEEHSNEINNFQRGVLGLSSVIKAGRLEEFSRFEVLAR